MFDYPITKFPKVLDKEGRPPIFVDEGSELLIKMYYDKICRYVPIFIRRYIYIREKCYVMFRECPDSVTQLTMNKFGREYDEFVCLSTGAKPWWKDLYPTDVAKK